MRIQHNILAMNSYRNYTNNVSALGKNLERLSSGYKINRAGDDAAGLAISEKMRAQITGLNAAQKNVKDGISLVKTAEGAMQEIQDMLNRMDYLATQSANGTYDSETDRAALQKEVNALREEINRIAESANFNGIKLLNGDLAGEKTTVTAIDPPINTTYNEDDSQDGIEPTKAIAAEYELTLTAAAADPEIEGDATAAAASEASYTSGAISAAGASAGGNELIVTVSWGDGESKDVTVSGLSNDDVAATVFGAIKDAIESDDELSALFTVGGSASGLTLTAKDTGSDIGTIGIKVSDADGGGTAVTIADNSGGVVKGTDDGWDLSGLTDGEGITVNGKTYTLNSGGTNGENDEYTSVANLIAALQADEGLEVEDQSSGGDGSHVVIKAAATSTTVAGLEIVDGETSLADLGDQEIGGTKISALFDVYVNGTKIDFDADGDTALEAGQTLKFVAKTPGRVSEDIETAFSDDTSVNVTRTEGKNEDEAAAAGKASYDLTFNTKNIAGNQRFQIGEVIFEITTSGELVDGDNVKIDVSDLDLTNEDDMAEFQQRLIDAIGTELDGYTATAGDVDAAAGTVKLTIEADDEGTASNLGNILVYDNPAAVTGTYTAGTDAAKTDKAQHTKVVYDIDFSKLSVGDKISIGGTEIEIVEADDEDIATGKLSLATAQDGTKFAQAMYGLGYQHIISFGTDQDGKTQMTITYAQQTGGGDDAAAPGNGSTSDTAGVLSAKDFAAGDAAVVFTAGGDTTTTSTSGKTLQLQIGDTSDDHNQMQIKIGDMHVTAMGTFNEDGELVTSIDDIDITDADKAADAINVIKDAINYVSGIRGDLGAYQNRLEHTANNLSVMAENIQDAESTIRDTDVADEMMAYVKNNILVQSAQAMLAQANQVPQGVLQLLG